MSSTFFQITQAFKTPLSVTERQDEARAHLAAAMLEASNCLITEPRCAEVQHELANAIALAEEWMAI